MTGQESSSLKNQWENKTTYKTLSYKKPQKARSYLSAKSRQLLGLLAKCKTQARVDETRPA